MPGADFDPIVAALAQARRQAQPMALALPEWAPVDLVAAYALQRATVEALGGAAAFKVSALAAAQQAAMGVAAPVAGALPRDHVLSSPAELALSHFRQPVLECEFAWELKHDLPPREAPYTREEVEAAVAALRIAVEVCDTRLATGAPLLAQLADGFNNGAFVVGPACAHWQALNFAEHSITLHHEGRELARGNGRSILDGDPLGALVLMANLRPTLGGLCAGQVITTGTCTPPVALPGPGRVEADFGHLGRVHLHFNGNAPAQQGS